MNTENIKPIPITPRPHVQESVITYLLRVSELNGYTSPRQLIRYAMPELLINRPYRLPAQPLSRILGENGNYLSHLSYIKNSEGDVSRTLKINSHTIQQIHLKLNEVRICPKCIKEKQYVDAYWDIKYAVVCPKHKIWTIQKCPGCGNTLTHYRRGLLTCKCGFDLSTTKTKKVDCPGTLVASEILWRKYHNIPISSDFLSNSKIPVKEINNLSLDTFLGLFSRVYNAWRIVDTDQNSPRRNDEFKVVKLTGDFFIDWPNGFYRCLRQIGEISCKNGKKSVNYRNQFHGFFNSFFHSSIDKEELEFIRREFVRFGANEWKNGLLDNRLLSRVDGEAKTGGITDIAKKLDIQLDTAKTLVKRNIIKPSYMTGDKYKRYVFDMSADFPIKDSCKNFDYRRAAKSLKLPVSVMNALRKKGMYSVTHIGERFTSYHPVDVENMRAKIVKSIKPFNRNKLDRNLHITIDEVMKKKVRYSDFKSDFIIEIVNRKLIPLGILGLHIGSIVLNRMDVDRYLEAYLIEKTGVVLAYKVANLLGVEIKVIQRLVEENYIVDSYIKSTPSISVVSLKNFANKYIFCTRIGKKINVSRKTVMDKLAEENIQTIVVKDSRNRSIGRFVERKYLPLFGIKEMPLFSNDTFSSLAEILSSPS